MASDEFIKKESGGNTKIILVTRVHKEATDEKMFKLVDEIEYLENMPEKWKHHFMTVEQSFVGEDRVYYEMPHYNLPTMRRLIFSGAVDATEVIKWVRQILCFAFEMYEEEKIEEPAVYMDYMHFHRFDRRMSELMMKSEIFREIIPKKTFSMNSVEYMNAPVIVNKLRNRKVSDTLKPDFYSKWGHSDLHFSNVMIDREKNSFILIDPRGYPFCDYIYDLGKIWHSVNGKYEFISERKFEWSGDELWLDRNQAFNICEQVKEALPAVFAEQSEFTKDELMKRVEFNEAMHFITLVPFCFDFDGIEDRARAAYWTGTALLNAFWSKYYGD